MASRLEAATKQFGVLLLLSEDFVECLSGPVRERVGGGWWPKELGSRRVVYTGLWSGWLGVDRGGMMA